MALNLGAQTDSASKLSITPTYTSIQTLTRSDIERLPVNSFLELVQGAFPFISDKSVIEGDYSFVVNGFVLINPNAINVSQIESISFYAVGTDITRGSMAKKGTFVISTRAPKNGLNFSTKTDLLLPDENTMSPYSQVTNSSKGFYSLDELSYHHKDIKWFTSNSFSFLKNKAPGYVTTNAFYPTSTSVSESSSEMRRFRFSNFAGYQFNEHMKIDGGLFFTSKPATADGKTAFTGTPAMGEQIYQSDNKGQLLSTHAGLTLKPSSRITSQLTAEMVRSKANGNSSFTRPDFVYPQPPTGTFYYGSNFLYRYTAYAVSDYFSWKPIVSSKVTIDFGLLAQGRWSKIRERNYSEQGQSGQPGSISTSYSTSSRKVQSFNVNPAVHLDFRQLLFAEAGFSYDSYKETWFGANKRKKLLPNVGARLELAPLLDSKLVSSLEFSANYNKYLTGGDVNDFLETDSRAVPSGSISGGPYYVPTLTSDYPTVENWLVSMSIGFRNNRLVLKSQYRNFNEMILWYTQVPYSSYVSMYDRLTTKGLCFELKTSIIEKQKVNWKLYATLYNEKGTLHFPGYQPITTGGLTDAGKAPWRGGLRTSVDYRGLFLQAAALFNLNEAAYDKNGNFQDDINRYNANFLLVGYKVPVKKGVIKGLEINAQSRSLFHSKSYTTSKYVGLGAQLDF